MTSAHTGGLSRRQVLTMAGAAALLPAMSGLVRAAGPASLTYITPQGLRLASAEVFVASAGGYFKKRGVEVKIVGGANSPQAVQQVLSGQAQSGRTAGVTLLNAVAKGGPVKSIATICHDSPFYMISTTEKPVNGPRDLVGATVGLISQNGPSENTLDAMLLAENIDPKSVTRQYTGDNPGAYALVEAGRIKAFMGAIDTYLLAKASHPNVLAFNTGKYMPLPGQIYLASDSGLKTDADALTAFLGGVKDAIAFIQNDKDMKETLRLCRTFPIEGASNDEASIGILQENLQLWLSAGPQNILRNVPENWSKGVDLAVRAGFGQNVPNDKLFTNALVDRL